MFPAFSKLNPEKEPELVKSVFATSVKYTALLLVPATMVLITLSTPLINTLFPKDGILHSLFVVNAAPKFPDAPLFLSFSILVNLLVLVGNVSLGTFQTGIRQTGQVMKQSILSVIVGLGLGYFIVVFMYDVGGPTYAVIGGLLGSLIATVPNVAWGLHWCWRKYKVKVDFGNSARIFASSGLASVVTYMFISLLHLPYIIMLVSGFIVFLMVYLISAPLLGAVNQGDIDNFKKMFAGLGIVSTLLAAPLVFMRKMCKMCKTNNDKKMLEAVN